jgi:hypothetical protein
MLANIEPTIPTLTCSEYCLHNDNTIANGTSDSIKEL